MVKEDWIKYCEERKAELEYKIEMLQEEITDLRSEIRFYERQIEKAKKEKERDGRGS